MNVNVLLGVISFVIWSSFGTWYYVTYIKQFDEQIEKNVAAQIPKSQETTIKEETDKNVEPEVSEETVETIDISKDFYFNKNSVGLIDSQSLNEFVDSLKNLLPNQEVAVHIIGHACDLGTKEHNYQLGLARADYVASALQSLGLDFQGKISSQGEASPLIPNTSEENRIQNRRVTITINSSP